ncbi:MAG: hypothetical protein N4J56_004620 [Chroococcidiopsis sp. SAG 2025]|uniref:hypothetical protein n=1 Tax=Chroococcidiopsis sp. SAG 2025 TaxID=171389 RepID=UPI0029370066|nr:hypothetical protein [Chroococcidiopsis sp. SAG 2025]MDV2994966.1 hypothetical protein [Chroococcidiopsis sp. SAG 2025]
MEGVEVGRWCEKVAIAMRENENYYHRLPFIKKVKLPYWRLWLDSLSELDDPSRPWYDLEANGTVRWLLPYEIDVQKQSLRLTYIKSAKVYPEKLCQRPY